MALIPPSQSEANEGSQSASDLIVTTANNAFIQHIIALIDNAIPLGLYSIYPPIPTNADYNTVAAYFQGLGYTVSISFPPPPFFGQTSGFPMGFPEATGGKSWWNLSAPPPAYPSAEWNSWVYYVQRHHPRMMINWGPAPESFLLLETGDQILLETGAGDILLE